MKICLFLDYEFNMAKDKTQKNLAFLFLPVLVMKIMVILKKILKIKKKIVKNFNRIERSNIFNFRVIKNKSELIRFIY